MNEAGVTREQEDLLIAIYRHGTKGFARFITEEMLLD